MLIYIALFFFVAAPLILLSVFAGIDPMSSSEYERAARDRAMSAYYQTGELIEEVSAYGRQMTVHDGDVDTFTVLKDAESERDWRKAMLEQAMIDVCLSIYAKCRRTDREFLWAFMPGDGGPVSDILDGPSAPEIDCRTTGAAEYALYGRHLFQQAIPRGMLSVPVTGGSSLNAYYSRPDTGRGCTYYDIVDFR